MADEDKIDGRYALTKPVLMAFPNLFEAKAFTNNGKASGEPKFSANFIYEADSEDLKALKALAAKIARAKWPSVEFKDLAFPFVSGDKLADAAKAKKKDGEYQRGKVVMSARSKYQPRLACFVNGKITDLDSPQLQQMHKGAFYPGVLVYAQFNLATHEVGNNKPGVNAYLDMVLTTGKGDRIAGGKTAAETFAGYVGNLSATDPTGGQKQLDDEIPF